MPTVHPRHSITETPELASVLDRLRDRLGPAMPPLGELLRRGALSELRELEARDRAQRDDLATFLARMRDAPAVDLDEVAAIRSARRAP